jgi:ArsR family transcriptional regulator, arsenate/arsenite/antimonite-responsive transcriptional repressor
VFMPATTSISLTVLDEADATVEALRFLSDGNRLRILQSLSMRESCVCELIEQLGQPQPLVSYHLRRLREAGLVRSRRQAQWVYYSIDPDAWARFTGPIRAFCDPGELPPAAAFGASDSCDTAVPIAALGANKLGAGWPE